MSLVGASFHRNICCKSRDSSVGSFQDLVSQHSWLPLQDTCLCPCTTDPETRKYPQELPGVSHSIPSMDLSCSGSNTCWHSLWIRRVNVLWQQPPVPCSKENCQLPFQEVRVELPAPAPLLPPQVGVGLGQGLSCATWLQRGHSCLQRLQWLLHMNCTCVSVWEGRGQGKAILQLQAGLCHYKCVHMRGLCHCSRSQHSSAR